MSTHLFNTLPHDRETIRLLVLEPTLNPDTAIRCRLITTKISDKPTYDALSYTWGEPSPTRLVNLNETPVEIRSNLHDCLLRLRDTERSRILWVDAICINQNDDEEKSHQIELMPHIYSGAWQVVAWLGESADGSEDVLTWIADNQRELRDLPQLQLPKNLLEPITRFFERQYWYRTWIIQELFKAQDVLFICGGCQLSVFKLIYFVKKCTHSEHHDHLKILLRRDFADINFPELLQLSSNTNCTDHRDKIYSLLGLLEATVPQYGLEADYTISTTDLFHKVLSISEIYTRNEEDGIQIRSLLKALNLRWSTLRLNDEYLNLGTDIIWYDLSLSTSFQALGNCRGVTWVKTKDVDVEDTLVNSPKTPNVYFALREVQDQWYKWKWTCVGFTWVGYHACAGYCSELRAIDCFFKDYEYYYRDVVVRYERYYNIGNAKRQTLYIEVPKLLAAAIQVYDDLGSRLGH